VLGFSFHFLGSFNACPCNGYYLNFLFAFLQSNFATLDEKTGIVTSRRADRHFEEGPIFCSALDGIKLSSFPEYEVRVKPLNFHK